MKRTWIGKYYDLDEKNQEIESSFRINVEINDDLSFTGSAWEEEFYSLSKSMVDVTGFINEGHINFVKKYPFKYEMDKNAKVFVDKYEPGNEVQYDGYWDNESEKWERQWEIFIGITEEGIDSYTEEVTFGNFEMKQYKTAHNKG